MAAFNVTLKAARVNADLTQKELAERLNVTVDTVINWESGKSEPRMGQLKQISELSGIPMDFIYVPLKS